MTVYRDNELAAALTSAAAAEARAAAAEVRATALEIECARLRGEAAEPRKTWWSRFWSGLWRILNTPLAYVGYPEDRLRSLTPPARGRSHWIPNVLPRPTWEQDLADLQSDFTRTRSMQQELAEELRRIRREWTKL